MSKAALEALESIKKEINATFVDKEGKRWYSTRKEDDERYIIIKQTLERNTPMKLVTEGIGQEPTCNNCFNHEPNKYDNYCANCGQKIDKEEDDE